MCEKIRNKARVRALFFEKHHVLLHGVAQNHSSRLAWASTRRSILSGSEGKKSIPVMRSTSSTVFT
ncbi:hypothetical protein EVA_10079 [gut metagenome]|uniref:Uncharacterized protein n=1 Tax=gut metagenome TaxID=749906 RepID=J9G3M4_9ZZZZ